MLQRLSLYFFSHSCQKSIETTSNPLSMTTPETLHPSGAMLISFLRIWVCAEASRGDTSLTRWSSRLSKACQWHLQVSRNIVQLPLHEVWAQLRICFWVNSLPRAASGRSTPLPSFCTHPSPICIWLYMHHLSKHQPRCAKNSPGKNSVHISHTGHLSYSPKAVWSDQNPSLYLYCLRSVSAEMRPSSTTTRSLSFEGPST